MKRIKILETALLAKLGIQALKWLLALALLCNFSAFATDYNFAPVSGQVTSPFGWRIDPMNGSQRFHGGIDIAASEGMPVYAPQGGRVMYSGFYGGYGNVVVLDHGNSLYTLYGHNSQLLVRPGESISRGQVIALVGSTGRSTGPHLHFEVHYNQQYLNPITYLSYLQAQAPMLAQASIPRSQGIYQNASGQAPVPQQKVARTTHRRATRRTGQTVQLVNGDKVQNIEF